MKENRSVFCSILGAGWFHYRHLDNALQMFLLRYFFFLFNIRFLFTSCLMDSLKLPVTNISSSLFSTGSEVLPVSRRAADEDVEDADSPARRLQVLTTVFHHAIITLTALVHSPLGLTHLEFSNVFCELWYSEDRLETNYVTQPG